MVPMRNRHTELVCRGLHELKETMRAKKHKAIYKGGQWKLEAVNE